MTNKAVVSARKGTRGTGVPRPLRKAILKTVG